MNPTLHYTIIGLGSTVVTMGLFLRLMYVMVDR